MGLPQASAVTVQPLLLAGTLLAAVVPLLVLRAAPHDIHLRARMASLGGGVVLLALIWFSPLQTLAQHYLLSAHLLQITVLMGAVPPLLLLALPRSPLHLPALLGAPLRVLVHPLFAIIAVNAAFFGWHITGPYVASMQSDTVDALQQLSLLAASLLFWWPITAPMGTHRSMSHLATMGYIL
ncbi:MAG: cytochrome c oxidase assembly protein, partial [Candidatus Dormibacteraeota bacterium]|nr:cytochrome c oxidase assembly protein [Candidatus Dormibacteraeota bacterium]